MSNLIDEVGKQYGEWIVLSRSLPNAPSGAVKWNCQCSCGSKRIISSQELRRGKTSRCLECNVKITSKTGGDNTFKDLTGTRVGKWTVLDQHKRDGHDNIKWLCKCDCGIEHWILKSALKKGLSLGCKNCATEAIKVKLIDPKDAKITDAPSVINRIGLTYGGWKVVARAQDDPGGGRQRFRWVGECVVCGKRQIFAVTGLLGLKKGKSCAKCSQQARLRKAYEARQNDGLGITIGDEIGGYKVLREQVFSFNQQRCLWVIGCIKCKNEFIRSSEALKRYKVKNENIGCTKCRHLNKLIAKDASWNSRIIPDSMWKRLVKSSTSDRKRVLEFTITREYCEDLLVKQNYLCKLTGRLLKIPKNNIDWTTAFGRTASLDRIDNTKGYIPGNVQWLHKDVNMLKSSYSQAEFVSICQEVARHTSEHYF